MYYIIKASRILSCQFNVFSVINILLKQVIEFQAQVQITQLKKYSLFFYRFFALYKGLLPKILRLGPGKIMCLYLQI